MEVPYLLRRLKIRKNRKGRNSTRSDNLLANVGDLAKPFDTLVKKIAKGVGTLYEPRRIKNVAKAETEAERITVRGSGWKCLKMLTMNSSLDMYFSQKSERNLHQYAEANL